MSLDERALARIRKSLAEEFPGGLSAADFVWKFLPAADYPLVTRTLAEFDQVHMGFRKVIANLAPSQIGEKLHLADELKNAASSYDNQSIGIQAWLQELDRKLSSPPGDAPAKKNAIPEILSFDVDKTSVPMNGTVALRWNTQNTTSVVLEQKTETEQILSSRAVDRKGTWNAIGIRQNCVFELKAIHSGSVVSRRQQVRVQPEPTPPPSPPPRPAPKPSPAAPAPTPPPSRREDLAILTYSVTPQRAQKGGSVVVEWTTSGAASAALELKAKGRSISKFNVPGSGTHRFANLQGPAIAELTATGFDGKRILKSIPIVVVRSSRLPLAAAMIVLLLLLASFMLRECSFREPQHKPVAAEILSLEARPTYVRPGGSVTLTWQTNNAIRAQIDGRPVATSGSLTIPHLHSSSTFVLAVTNSDGAEVHRSVQVEVESPLKPQPPPQSPVPSQTPSPPPPPNENTPSPNTAKPSPSINDDAVQVPPVTEPTEQPAPHKEGYVSCTPAPVATGGLASFLNGDSQLLFPAGHYRFEIAPAYPWRVLIKHQVDGTQIVTVTPLSDVALANCRLHWTLLQE